MQLAARGRFVFIAQWVLAVLLPVFVFVGRWLVGAELGWMAVIGVAVYGLPTIVILLLPPIVALLDRPARAARSVRVGYAWATVVLWVALVVGGLTIPDSGDSGHLVSALSAWTGVSYETSELIFYVAFGVSVLAWLGAMTAAIVGAVASRRSAAVAR